MKAAHHLALSYPLGADATDTAAYRNRWQSKYGLVTSVLTTEVCGCLGPVWHVSLSIQQPSMGLLDRPDLRYFLHLLAHKMLLDVGQPDQEMWWWNSDAHVGHLRVHLTTGERLLMGPVVAELPDDHDEPGEWFERSLPAHAWPDAWPNTAWASSPEVRA